MQNLIKIAKLLKGEDDSIHPCAGEGRVVVHHHCGIVADTNKNQCFHFSEVVLPELGLASLNQAVQIFYMEKEKII